MKTRLLICLAFALLGFIAYTTCIQSNVSAFPSGISGFSGSIYTGGQYCSSCHSISSTKKSDNFKIISNIPSSGYVPDQVYKFSILIDSKQPRAGFDVRIENAKGLVAGEISNIDDLSRTEQGELIHTYDTFLKEGIGKFDFTWKAPAEGGIANVYAAVATLLNNGTNDMDTLNLFNFSLNQDITTSISGTYLNESFTDFYAFEENGIVEIRYHLSTLSEVTITLVDSKGTVSKNLFSGNAVLGTQSESFKSSELPEGIYLIKMLTDKKLKTTKIVIN